MLKREVCRVHTTGLTWSWSSSARSEASFRSTKEKRTLAASAEQGGNREELRNKWFGQLLVMSPPNRSQGRSSEPRPRSSSQPSQCVFMAAALGGKTQEPDIARAQPHAGNQNLLGKVGPAARCSKASKEARLVERKACFILEAGNLGV